MGKNTVSTFLDNATEFLNQKKYDLAIKEFQNALEIENKNIEALKGIGLCAFNIKDTMLAIDSFKKALDINPQDATALYYLASLHILNNEIEDAIIYSQKVIELRPDYFEAYKILFTIYLKTQRFKDILNLYKIYNENNVPTADDTIHLTLGTTYMMKKNYKKAIEFLKTAHKITPNKEQTLNNLGICYMSLNDFDSAINAFEQAIQVNPNNHISYTNLGTVYQLKGELLKSLETFNIALELMPDNFLTLLNIANLSNVLRKYDIAIKSYEKLLQKNPNLKEIQSSLIGAYIKNNQPDKAINLIDVALKQSPRNVPMLFRKAKIYTDLGDFNAATKIYEQILSFKKNSPTIYHAFAVLYTKMQDYDKALQNLNKSIMLDEKNAQAHKDLGIIYLMRNQVEYAKEEFDIAIKLGKTDNEILKECADFYYSISEFKKSEELYRQSIQLEQNPFTSLSLGINLIAQNKIDEAFATLEPLLTVIPDNPELLYNLARISYFKNDFDMAARLAKKAYFVVPTIEIANLLGLCLKNIEDYDGAANIFDKILTEYPHNLFIYQNLIYCYEKANNIKGLIKTYQTMIEKLPYEEENIIKLAEQLIANKQKEEALKVLHKANFEHPTENLKTYISKL